jgi:hypothetical protein
MIEDTEGHTMLVSPVMKLEMGYAREREIQQNLISRSKRVETKETKKEKKGDKR